MSIFSIFRFERRGEKLISPRRFLNRMLGAVALCLMITFVGLVVGMLGYMAFEGMSMTDAYLNAAMILSGMGPIGSFKTAAGKIFAGSYAIFSGLVIVIATGVVLAPIFHRMMHRFHLEDDKAEDD